MGIILRGELSGGSSASNVPALQSFAHPLVRCFAWVIVVGTCGIDVDELIEPGKIHLMAENVFSGRRAANVAETDKKNVVGFLGHDGDGVLFGGSGK